MWLRSWVGAVVLAVLAMPAYGQVQIEWKFKEGDRLYMKNVVTMKQSVEVLGQRQQSNMTNTTVSSFTVLKKTADSLVLQQKIEEQKIKAEGPLAAEQERAARLMKGVVFTYTLDGKGRITKFEGYDDFVKRMAEGNEEVAKVLRVMISEDTFKQGIQEAFSFVPDKPVAKGDTWKNKMSMSMGPIGQFTVDQLFTSNGPTKGGELISIKADFRHRPAQDDGGGVLPFKVTKSNLATKRAVGSIVFDTAKGRVVSHDFDAHLAGPMTLSIQGQEAEMTMDMEISTKVSWSDNPPKP